MRNLVILKVAFCFCFILLSSSSGAAVLVERPDTSDLPPLSTKARLASAVLLLFEDGDSSGTFSQECEQLATQVSRNQGPDASDAIAVRLAISEMVAELPTYQPQQFSDHASLIQYVVQIQSDREQVVNRILAGRSEIVLEADEREAFIPLSRALLCHLYEESGIVIDYVRSHVDWPRISEFGANTSLQFWSLAQHQDHNPVLQQALLYSLEQAVQAGEANPRHFALLQDRVLVNGGRKQVYGTQVDCEDGVLSPLPLIEPEQVDERRRAVGLEPIVEYLSRFGSCT